MNSDPAYSSNSSAADSAQLQQAGQQKHWPNALKRQPAWMRYGLLGAAGLSMLLGSVAGYKAVVGSLEEIAPAQSRVLPVDTLAIERVSAYQVPRIYTGEITALRSSNLGFERGGELVEVMVNEGDRVRAGTPIAGLDTQNLATQRRQISAQKTQAQARLSELENGARPEEIAAAKAEVRDLEQQLALQKTQEQRREYLYAQGAIAKEQLDEFAFGANSLQAKLDQARSRLNELINGTRFEQIDGQRAAVEQLQAQLDDIDVNIAKSTITAPFDGIIAERSIDEGTVLNAGQAVVELIEAAAPEAQIGLPAAVANQLQVGSVQTIRVNNQPYQAEVAAILPQVDSATRTQKVVLKLEPSAIGEIEPGQTARLTINETIQTDGYWLPTEALTQGIRGLWTCYVLVPEETVESDAAGSTVIGSTMIEQRSVEIIQQESTGKGAESKTRALVRGTLNPGEKVVASGVHRLVAGQRVRAIAPQ